MMKFEHRLRADKVRQMCINYDYYTCGDCRAYENMFNMFMNEKDVTPELLMKVAEDIKLHSDTYDSVQEIFIALFRLVTVFVPMNE